MEITVFQIKPKIIVRKSRVVECDFYDIVDTDTSLYLQCFKPPHIDKIVLSSYNVPNPQSFINDLNIFLASPTSFQIIQTMSTSYILYKTLSTTFKIKIKSESYHYSIKIGSDHFQDCVDIIVYKTDSQHQKLAQIYSEPECWEDLVKGNTVEMIKSALQFINCVFNVHSFEFDDNSNVECGITNISKKAPRKLSNPFSLSHLYLATKGETWYEHMFAASMLDQDRYNDYKSRKRIILEPINISFEEFVRHAQLTKDQQSNISSFYSPEKTWIEFFNSIPKSKHCELVWLPFFIENYILYDNTKSKERDRRMEIRKEPWVIRLSPQEEDGRVMTRTFIHVITDPTQYKKPMIGGKIRRRKTRRHVSKQSTRKNTHVLFSFNNDPPSHTV